MTEGAFRSFIKSFIRRATQRWKPKYDVKRAARHHEKLPNDKGRLVFHSLCKGCGKLRPESTCTIDHIKPIVDPRVGMVLIGSGEFKGEVDWNPVIYKALCENDNLQALCAPCHDAKTREEKQIDTERRRAERST